MGSFRSAMDEETREVLAGIEEQDDLRAGYAALKRRIEALRNDGRPVPDELLTAERQLSLECMAASQGR